MYTILIKLPVHKSNTSSLYLLFPRASHDQVRQLGLRVVILERVTIELGRQDTQKTKQG
jgi:hypothetical protein